MEDTEKLSIDLGTVRVIVELLSKNNVDCPEILHKMLRLDDINRMVEMISTKRNVYYGTIGGLFLDEHMGSAISVVYDNAEDMTKYVSSEIHTYMINSHNINLIIKAYLEICNMHDKDMMEAARDMICKPYEHYIDMVMHKLEVVARTYNIIHVMEKTHA